MFSQTAAIHDAIYSWRNYQLEVERLETAVTKLAPGSYRTLLDVGVGTGAHVPFLSRAHEVEGLDLDGGLLDVARKKFPGIRFHEADMERFKLDRRFDIVVSLFSSIGYVRTFDSLCRAVRTMGSHLSNAGVLAIEPWFSPDEFRPGVLHANFVDQPDLKIARMNVSKVEGTISILDFRYLVGTPAGVRVFEERHELGLFTKDQYFDAFRRAQLQVAFDPEGPTGRGLVVGVNRIAKDAAQ